MGDLIQVIRGHTDNITHLDLNEQNTDLLSASADGTARMWRLVPRAPEPPLQVPGISLTFFLFIFCPSLAA